MQQRKSISTLFVVLSLCLCLALMTGCGTKTRGKRAGSTGDAVAKTATSQIGKYYKYGGTSPKTGFDCSGLIWWAYDKHGIKVPRVTTDQAKTGKKVHSKRAQAGDIVVFKVKGTSTGLHTGIYLGDNKFVHSPRTGAKVRIESLNSYWKPKLSSVRRVVK